MRLLNMPTASSAYVLPCNVYGPGQRTHGDRANVVGALVSRFTHAVQTDAEFVHCFGRGASREFVFVRDCADAIVDALQRIANASPINIGSGVATNIGTLTKCVAKHIGFSGRIDWSDDDGTVDALWSSDEHARQVLAWRPSTSLDAGLAETVDWYRNKEGAA
jgi:GDP-L-fucose synthase